MPGTFDWDDAEEIGIQLAEKFPDADPLSVRFTDLHKWVTELAGFTGDPQAFERRQARSHSDGLARGTQGPPGQLSRARPHSELAVTSAGAGDLVSQGSGRS